jgi:Rps23 Pro-64 3,4-dihydroxylase Tpa1-like proline 4-hydroxylase
MKTDLVQNNISTNTLDLDLFSKASDRLRENSESFKQEYNQGKPYPHLVIDDLFEPELLDRLVAEFPNSQNRDWITWDTTNELKSTSRGINGLSMFSQLMCLWLSSSEFIGAIQPIVGMDNLVGDPLFHGAGLHEMFPGGWLGMHADYTRHFSLPLMRQINLLVYLNRDWDASWGGELALQYDKNSDDQVSYAPYFNRTIIFPTTAKTFHGVLNRLSCPGDRSRQLLSIYYWTPVPMPLFAKAGTPLLWASEQKKKLKKALGKS